MKIENLFEKPGVIGLIGDVNTAKSNLLYHIITILSKKNKFNLFSYGLRSEVFGTKIHSVEELEKITNSVVVIDEVMTLWDLNNRMAKRQIENTLRLIFHNNNVLIICGVPDNFRKFIAGKLDYVIFKQVTIADFVNGCRVKRVLTNYKGNELGSNVLNLPKNEALVFDGSHYSKINVPYYPKYDSKKKNPSILVKKSVNRNVNGKKMSLKSEKQVLKTKKTSKSMEEENKPVEETEETIETAEAETSE